MNRLLSPCTCARRALAISTPLRPSFSSQLPHRSLHAPAAIPQLKRVPKPREPYSDPASILRVSQRGLEQYADKLEEAGWQGLFTQTSTELRDMGMTIKESRYLLWLLERYRQGHDPANVAVAPTPKKTIRGWGPKVQNGVRVR
ncbi:hypothetical protein JCM11641_001980 [Rhodosporidiobolus odoratus]